jgi:hypothetical protein
MAIGARPRDREMRNNREDSNNKMVSGSVWCLGLRVRRTRGRQVGSTNDRTTGSRFGPTVAVMRWRSPMTSQKSKSRRASIVVLGLLTRSSSTPNAFAALFCKMRG